MEFGEKNVGKLDQAVRGIIGLAFLGAFGTGYATGFWGIISLALGILLFATALFGTCALYTLLGMSTAEKKRKK